jgi:hypothetical protein
MIKVNYLHTTCRSLRVIIDTAKWELFKKTANMESFDEV